MDEVELIESRVVAARGMPNPPKGTLFALYVYADEKGQVSSQLVGDEEISLADREAILAVVRHTVNLAGTNWLRLQKEGIDA